MTQRIGTEIAFCTHATQLNNFLTIRGDYDMPVEHRWSPRKPISMEVSLFYPPLGSIKGKTRNISLEGMYVETEGAEIPQQARLEVAFITRQGDREKIHRLPAYVVHSRDKGVGLMLQHVGYNEFDALRYMLNVA